MLRVLGESESFAETRLGVSPEGGAFVALTDNVRIRLGVGLDVIWIAGGASNSIRVVTGFMFGF